MSDSSNFNFLAFIGGGLGPDVWDKQLPLFADDISDALRQALAQAEERGGMVFSVEQWDYPEKEDPSDLRRQRDALQSENAKLRDGLKRINRTGMEDFSTAFHAYVERGNIARITLEECPEK